MKYVLLFLLPLSWVRAEAPAMQLYLAEAQSMRATILRLDGDVVHVQPLWADQPMHFPLAELQLLTRGNRSGARASTPPHTLIFQDGDELSGHLLALADGDMVLQTPWGQEVRAPVKSLHQIRMVPDNANVLISDLSQVTLTNEDANFVHLRSRGYVHIGGEMISETEGRAQVFLPLPAIEGSFSLTLRLRFDVDFSNYQLFYFSPPIRMRHGSGNFTVHSYGANIRMSRREQQFGGLGNDDWQTVLQEAPGRVHEIRLVYNHRESQMRLYRNQELIRTWTYLVEGDFPVFAEETGLHLTMNSTPAPTVDHLEFIAYPGEPPATLRAPADGFQAMISLQNGDQIDVKDLRVAEGHFHLVTEGGMAMRVPMGIVAAVQFRAQDAEVPIAAHEVRLGAARTRLTVNIAAMDSQTLRVQSPLLESELDIPWEAVDLLQLNPERNK